MTQSHEFRQIWNRIDRLHEYCDDIDPQEIIATIRCVRSSFETSQIAEDEYHHFLGYLGYHFNEYLSEPIHFLDELIEAVRLNEKSSWSWLYLGYSYFDIKKWESAFAAFDHIEDWGDPPIQLKLKIEELQLACRLHSEPQAVFIAEIDRFLDRLAVVPFDEKAFPTELRAAIESSKFAPPCEKERLLKRIRAEMDLDQVGN